LTLALIVIATANATACNIPVFRYALERWKPDACEVIVFYDGELTEDQSTLLDRLKSRSEQGQGHANAKIIPVDLSNAPAPDRSDLWQGLRQNAEVTLPHVLVRTKLGRGQLINHWHGTLKQANGFELFQSPVRVELRDRLLAGHSVVWLLVKSKEHAKSAAAKTLAQQTFKTLASKVTLPEGIGLPGSELYSDLPLVLKFSLLEIDPEDPKEEFLVRLLTGVRLQAFDDGEPLLVPVFGRGRALEVIPARDMSPKLMEELTLFLSAACSCQVKEQNPGFDLLIDADWDTELFGDDENRPPDRSAEEGRNRKPALVPIPPGRK
jgi:hypothetical protein